MATAKTKKAGVRLKNIPGNFVIFGIKKEQINRHGIYDGSRYAWRAKLKKAKLADFVIAVLLGSDGLILSVYIPKKWNIITNSKSRRNIGRIFFKGVPSTNPKHKSYIGNYLPQNLVPKRNPVRYSY